MTKRAVIYARTSSNDSERDSLSSQVDECLKYAKEKGYKIVDTLKESERGQSGADLQAPALQQALSLARQGRFDVLVVRDITRYTRSKRKGHITDYAFEDSDVAVEFVWNQFGDNEYSELLKDMFYIASEQERKDTARRMRVGREKKIAEGSLITHGKQPPYGYRSERINKLFKAFIVESEAEVVKMIFRWYAHENMSLKDIADELNKQHYVTRQGKKWRPDGVNRILRNSAYIGQYIYGKWKIEETTTWQNGKVETSRKFSKHPESHHKIIPIPPIVDQDIFNLVQRKLTENATKQGKEAKYDYLVARHIRCGNCNRAMCAKPRDNRGIVLYYYCIARNTDKCSKYVSADRVDEIVWNWLESLLRDKDLLQQKMKDYLKEQEEKIAPLKTALANIDNLLSAKRKQSSSSLSERGLPSEGKLG